MTHPTQQQKLAWFYLIVTTATLVVVAGLVPLLGPSRAMAGFALLSVIALAPIIARRKEKDEVQNDERETTIRQRAGMYTAGAMLIFIIAACNFAICCNWQQKSVPMDAIAWIVWGAACVFQVAYSIAVLLQYRNR